MFYLYFNCVLKFGFKFKLRCEDDRVLVLDDRIFRTLGLFGNRISNKLVILSEFERKKTWKTN